ncbi:MAG: mechanosensitive ion channel family protein [archaeon]
MAFDFNQWISDMLILSQNSGNDYLWAAGIFVGTIILLKIFKLFVLKRLEKFAKSTKNDIDDAIVEFIDEIGWPFYMVISVYISLRFIVVAPWVTNAFNYILVICLVFYGIKGIQKVIGYLINKEIEKRKKSEDTAVGHLHVLERTLGIVVWIVALLFLLSNFGVQITSLIAGLGIGGLAIAFALQHVFEDIFSSFSIYFDKPFTEGDFIVIGADKGVVKQIGLKTTRIKTLQGEELVISNKELTSTRVNNFKRMKKRRIAFTFGLTYDTSVAKLKKANEIVTKIAKQAKVELDRTHFKEFGDFSLNFEVIYYMDVPDYAVYMDKQQEINLGIKQEFEKAGIEMAFPTQTLHVEKSK